MGYIVSNIVPPDQTTTNDSWWESTRVAIPSHSAGDVHLYITAVTEDGLYAASWVANFVVKRNSGNVVIPSNLVQKTNVRRDSPQANGWDIDVIADGGDILVSVKGSANTTIMWSINGSIDGPQRVYGLV